jgi:hypothetical protein
MGLSSVIVRVYDGWLDRVLVWCDRSIGDMSTDLEYDNGFISVLTLCPRPSRMWVGR